MTAGVPNKCPCCGQGVMREEAAEFPRMGAMQQALLDIVRSAAPERISRDAIVARLYANARGGGPVDPSNVVSVMVRQINKKLAPYGTRIWCGAGRRDGYRLESMRV